MFTSYIVHRVVENNMISKVEITEQCDLCFSCAVKAVINKDEAVESIIFEDSHEEIICDDC